MVAGFVAVSILSDKTGDVGSMVFAEVCACREKVVETFVESLVTAHYFCQAFYIVRHEEGVLPGVAFCVVVSLLIGVEVRWQGTELTLHVERTHHVDALVVEFLAFAKTNGDLDPTAFEVADINKAKDELKAALEGNNTAEIKEKTEENYNKGVANYNAGKYEEAKAAYDKAVQRTA